MKVGGTNNVVQQGVGNIVNIINNVKMDEPTKQLLISISKMLQAQKGKEQEVKKTYGIPIEGKKVDPTTGITHEGIFIDEQLSGKGREIHKNGAVYEGPFADGLKHGMMTKTIGDYSLD